MKLAPVENRSGIVFLGVVQEWLSSGAYVGNHSTVSPAARAVSAFVVALRV